MEHRVMYAGRFDDYTARAWSGKYLSVTNDQADLLPWADTLEVMTGFSGIALKNIAAPRPAKVIDLLPARFNKLVIEWKAAKGPISSVSAMAMLPSYQSIIGMGKPALPLILSQLKQEGGQPDMWFWALKAISEADPVSDDDRGDLAAMAKAWLDWGVRNGVSHG